MSWPIMRLGDVAQINPRLPKNIDDSQTVSFVAMASAGEDGMLLNEEPRILAETKKGFTYFENGDVLLAKITPCFENGKCLRPGQISNQVGFGSTEFHVLRADEKLLDPGYLFYMIWSKQFRFLGEKSMSGAAGQKRVSTDFVAEFEIPLPPLEEQKRIATILGKADAIRRKRQQAIQLADEFLRAVFLDMFGDPVTNPKGWKIVNSGDIYSVPPRIGTTIPAKGEGRLVVRVGEIGQFNIAFERCGRVQLSEADFDKFVLVPGDTVLARAIGSKSQLGKASYYYGHPESVVIDSHVMRLRPNNKICNPEWFYRLISSDGGKSLLQKAGGETAVQFNINAKQASALKIPLPPLSLQNKFIELCSSHLQASTKSLMQEQMSNELFNSLSKKAFSGEL